MRVQGLQHVPFDDIGAMAPWLAARGVIPDYNRFYEDGLLPPVDALDLVIVMGGPMSVNDEAQLPWLRAEKRFLREAIGHGIRVLGVSLGAQPIANVLGARGYPNAENHCRDELAPAPWIQTEAAIRVVDAAVYAEASCLMGCILDDLVGPGGA